MLAIQALAKSGENLNQLITLPGFSCTKDSSHGRQTTISSSLGKIAKMHWLGICSRMWGEGKRDITCSAAYRS